MYGDNDGNFSDEDVHVGTLYDLEFKYGNLLIKTLLIEHCQIKILQKKGDELATEQIEKLRQQLISFRESLERISHLHGDKIKSDPHLRSEFHKMSPKNSIAGFFGFGEFYCQLGIQIIDICVSTRPLNGGFIEINDLQKRLQKLRERSNDKITVEDIRSSISQLHPLSGGYKILKLNNKEMVQSVPHEFSQDHISLLSLFQTGTRYFDLMKLEYISTDMIEEKYLLEKREQAILLELIMGLMLDYISIGQNNHLISSQYNIYGFVSNVLSKPDCKPKTLTDFGIDLLKFGMPSNRICALDHFVTCLVVLRSPKSLNLTILDFDTF
ncbi:hypothetical protein BB560_001474 [Smittium megazygosporum]|uniref:Uncharacterized protein n=1 Tax=Smittium megazygosporum TaxID=133381 RepID=A0A2T9ZHP9_9FUNG|nr:hypothetical protein BB560_001474 [Smittium megazygosporum]